MWLIDWFKSIILGKETVEPTDFSALLARLDEYKNAKNLTDEDYAKRYGRYIRYLFEIKGYKVNPPTSEKKYFGIDFVARNRKDVTLIQFKRWSGKSRILKKLAVEQLSRALEAYKKDNPKLNIEACIYSPSGNIDEQAREEVNLINNIQIITEPYPFDVGQEYPLIKCNISTVKGKVYHLPTSGSYDLIRLKVYDGEKYVSTPQEAEVEGFRVAK